MARARGKSRSSGVPAVAIVEIDGSPYVDAGWLELRIYRDESRVQRWRQEARRVVRRTDPDGLALHAAYLWHALLATYRVEKWRRCLTVTLAALEKRHGDGRAELGRLIRDRRVAARMTLRDLASRAGVDHKTILNIETAKFPPSERTLERVISVRELNLSWADVSPTLLEANPARARKRQARKRRNRRPSVSK